jgi:hypothetical protein
MQQHSLFRKATMQLAPQHTAQRQADEPEPGPMCEMNLHVAGTAERDEVLWLVAAWPTMMHHQAIERSA